MFIVEHVLPGAEQLAEQRGLLYPVSVSTTRASPDASQPPPPAPESDQGRRRCHHRHPRPSSPHPPSVHGQSSSGPVPRALVHTRSSPVVHREVDSVQLVDSTLLSPSAPTADRMCSQVPQEATMLNQEAMELMHGKPIGDCCSAWSEGEISRSSVGPAAAEECPAQVSSQEGEAATSCLGRHASAEAQLVHRPSSSPGPPSTGPDDGPDAAPSVGLSPEKNETILLDSSQLCSSPLVVYSSSAAPTSQSSQAPSQASELLQALVQGTMGKPGGPQVSAAPPLCPPNSSSTASLAAPYGPISSSLLVPG
jgi:hypothetical protein